MKLSAHSQPRPPLPRACDCHDRTSVLEIRWSEFSGFRKTRNEQTMIINLTSVLQALKKECVSKKGPRCCT